MTPCSQKHAIIMYLLQVCNKLSGDCYSMAFEDLLETSGKLKFVYINSSSYLTDLDIPRATEIKNLISKTYIPIIFLV